MSQSSHDANPAPTIDQLVLLQPDGAAQWFSVQPGRRLSIGRGPDNEVVLNDPGIARYQALLLCRDGHLALRDHSGDRRTFLNGRLVDGEVPLKRRDSIEIGSSARFIILQPGDALPVPEAKAPAIAAPGLMPATLSRLGAYRIAGVIGSGGMATVYRAENGRERPVVALKVPYQNLQSDAELMHLFRREASIGQDLHHPNIVEVYSLERISGISFLVMEYVDGPSLGKWMQETTSIPQSEAVHIVTQICQALAYAHAERRIIHLDIKPGNILLTTDRRAKLGDFGIARYLNSPGHPTDQTTIRTYKYMSPEQAQNDPDLDHRSDIYSLGVVLYQMVVGKPPFSGGPTDLAYHHVHTPPPPPRSINPAIGSDLEEVILIALAKKPRERFQHDADFDRALQSCHLGKNGSEATEQKAGQAPVRAVLVVRRGPLDGTRIAVPADGIVLSRDNVRDRYVSRQHCRIVHRDGEYWVEDLGSQNGTLLNGREVGERPRPLRFGDSLWVGRTELVFLEEGR